MTEKIIPEANVLYQGKTITGNTLDRSKNLIWNFMNAVSQHPDAIAIEGDGTWTYAMFLKEVQKGAAALQNSGVVQGDYVGVYCTPTARTIGLMHRIRKNEFGIFVKRAKFDRSSVQMMFRQSFLLKALVFGIFCCLKMLQCRSRVQKQNCMPIVCLPPVQLENRKAYRFGRRIC